MHDQLNNPSDDPHVPRNARRGLVLFFIYVVVYALFVYLSAFRADLMAWQPMGGVNLAIWYGLGLIVFAIVLAVIYMLICKSGNDRARGER
jgi:uncharacterized membrane protein (DUF485 family)